MHLSLIVAADENNGIGVNGNQPVFIRDDLKKFKALTTGNTIVMGRKTFEALPKGALPNRRNIVLTRKKDFSAPGCETVNNPGELKELCAPDEKVFVIGGGEIYSLFFPDAEAIYFTLIHEKFEDIDTWFPEMDRRNWRLENTEGPFTDEKNNISYSYYKYLKKKDC